MEDNLIRDIGAAERDAAGIISTAREEASLRLKQAQQEALGRAEEDEIRFAERKKSEIEKGRQAGEIEAAAIEKNTLKLISTIEKEGTKKKEEVIAFLIHKILE